MKRWALALAIVFSCHDPAFSAATTLRTISEIPEAREFLRRTVHPQFYRSLLQSPLAGWVTARGQLAGDRLCGVKIVRSDLEGTFDEVALDLAKNLQVLGGNIVRQHASRFVLVHLLVYQIADGKLTVSFAHFDEPGGGQMRNHGAAWMAVRKDDGRWVTIEPRWHLRREHRGPRSYAFFAQEPGVPARFRGTGEPMHAFITRTR